MTGNWTTGNSVRLLENGEEYFPRILELIQSARYEILIETFILREDRVGNALRSELLRAVERGVRVSLAVDGYGSYYLSHSFIASLSSAGVSFCMYDPPPRWMSFRTNIFRRLHRKLVIIDAAYAFVGGINLSHNHTREYGPLGKQDYAVELRGPVVEQVRRAALDLLKKDCQVEAEFPALPVLPDSAPGDADIRFVLRDNRDNRTAIEQEYINRIRQARKRVTIANAYFFPGYRLLRELRNAARRGVKVKLVIQGKPGSAIAMKTVPMLYDFLVESEIEVYEYWERPLHGKIATVDDDWATVGSSNLDPLSLSLNLEANVIIRDTAFTQLLTERIEALTAHSDIRKINDSWIRRRTLWKWFRTLIVFHFLRHFPSWVGWLPAHTPRVLTESNADKEVKA